MTSTPLRLRASVLNLPSIAAVASNERQKMKISRVLLAILLVLTPIAAAPQAPTSLSLVRVLYNTRKATVSPQGDLKVQIDALDKEIGDAMRLGRSGEARRLFAKGMA